ncbi:MAG: ABC-2 family transporter protein [Treponema sp.]|jgi:ABC-2 type transport system permease protein|nr:ABC-2 family transporter protein [Treponema sp.]
MLATIKRYLAIYGLFVKFSIMSQMEYRLNFFISAGVQLAHICTKLTYIVVLYSTGVVINGFSPDEMTIMIGTYTALSGVFVSLFLINFDGLSGHIQRGTLDTYIVKPISLQFIATLRHVDLAFAFVSLIAGGVMVALGWSRAGVAFTPLKILGFLGFVFWGLFLTYSVFLIPNILCFWTTASSGVSALVGQLWDFNNMPMTIYDGLIKVLGTFIIPVFLITNMGGLFVLEKLSPAMIAWSILAPVVFFIISRILWNRGMKRYVSVSG